MAEFIRYSAWDDNTALGKALELTLSLSEEIRPVLGAWLVANDLTIGEVEESILETQSVKRTLRELTRVTSFTATQDVESAVKIKHKLFDKKKVKVSKETRGTGVWRMVSRGEHILSIKWERYSGGQDNRGVGVLYVAFASGGDTYGGKHPVYSYDGVKYDEYYELWKRISSPGSWVHRVVGGKPYKKEGVYGISDVTPKGGE